MIFVNAIARHARVPHSCAVVGVPGERCLLAWGDIAHWRESAAGQTETPIGRHAFTSHGNYVKSGSVVSD